MCIEASKRLLVIISSPIQAKNSNIITRGMDLKKNVTQQRQNTAKHCY